MVRKRRVLLLALPLVCMAVAAGCGDDEGGGDEGDSGSGEAFGAEEGMRFAIVSIDILTSEWV